MTDTNKSGDPVAPAAESPAPAARAETPAGSFGSTRGSGLARGRRPMSAAAPTANPAKADYKPTAIEVITHEREYRNPFASQEPASAPATEPVKVETPAAPAAVEAESKEQAASAAPVTLTEQPAEKPEIQILPPAEANRPAVRWESPSGLAPRREPQFGDRPDRARTEHRPSFRADRREDRVDGPRPEGRDPRRDQLQREPRQQFDQRPRRDQDVPADRGAPAAKAASGGFLGWLKRLLGAGKPADVPVARDSLGEPFNDAHRHRRRHRGGRGHGGSPQGYRGERFPQGGEYESRGGERHGGHRRRRHRGGPGRDRGGDPRSEGQQGGGAI